MMAPRKRPRKLGLLLGWREEERGEDRHLPTAHQEVLKAEFKDLDACVPPSLPVSPLGPNIKSDHHRTST